MKEPDSIVYYVTLISASCAGVTCQGVVINVYVHLSKCCIVLLKTDHISVRAPIYVRTKVEECILNRVPQNLRGHPVTIRHANGMQNCVRRSPKIMHVYSFQDLLPMEPSILF